MFAQSRIWAQIITVDFVDIDRLPSGLRDVVDEVGVGRNRVSEANAIKTLTAKQLDPNHLSNHGIPKSPNDDSDIAAHIRPQYFDAPFVQNHVGVDLHEERSFRPLNAGVQRPVEWNRITDNDRMTWQNCLAAEAGDRVVGRRLAQAQYDRRYVVKL